MNSTELFDDITEFPDSEAMRRLAGLVGLDDVKSRLTKEARLLLNPTLLEDWSQQQHGCIIPATKKFKGRSPLFIFEGDVGTGKSELAETFGDAVARAENIPVSLFHLSLNARGSGSVGEMTRLIAAAFAEVSNFGTRSIGSKKPTAAGILIIDEADALAQSRELSQMHHEDRAGVNALIRGLNTIGNAGLPVIVVMCTNRLGALDPAVVRRASAIFRFTRPTEHQRTSVLGSVFANIGLSGSEVAALASATGASLGREYGFTFSDITQRLLPAIVLDAFPDKPILFARALEIASTMAPTPPFKESSS